MAAVEPVNPVEPGYMLAPAARLLWRSPTSVHLELGNRAVIVDGLPIPVVQHVARAAPTDLPSLTDASQAEIRHALQALADAGYLWPRATSGAVDDGADTDDVVDDERLHVPGAQFGPEFAALSVRHGTHAARVLSTRRTASVQLLGPGRVTAHLGAVLAAAGVGHVHCALRGATLLHHALPGGARPADEGQPLSRTAERAIRAAAADTDTRAPEPRDRPDLTVLVADGPADEDRRRALHASNAPYLVVNLGIDHAVVGPLVLPGLTSCLRCADLHRLDRDPAWPALATQLRVPRRYGPASDVATATTLTGIAAAQALAFLDGDEPAVIDATIELRRPDWQLRRRSWPPHPDCDCADTVADPTD